jgi:hypothetical protein
MLTKTMAQIVYGIVGVVFLLVGASVLLLGTGLLPEAVKNPILNIANEDLYTLHLMQELASLLVLVGLLTFWFFLHYDKSRPFHWVMTFFWGLIALVHWFDPNGTFHSGMGEAIISIPFVLFVGIGLLRLKTDSAPGPR